MMLTQQSIRDFLAQSDYDIRESGNGRWIDQLKLQPTSPMP